MIVVVEGIDRVGKTTLCKRLKEELGCPIFKSSPYYKDKVNMEVENELMNQALNYAGCIENNVVFDRFHFSEFVYGYFNRHYVNKEVFEFDKRLSMMDSLLVLVKPTDIKRSSEEHGENLSTHEALFETMFNFSRMRKLSCDYNEIEKIVSAVVSMANEKR